VWLWISRLCSRESSSVQNSLYPDLARKVRWRLRHERLPRQQLPRRCILKASHGWSWNLLHWDGRWYRFGGGDAFASNADGSLDPSQASHCLLTTAEVKAIAATWLTSVYSNREWA